MTDAELESPGFLSFLCNNMESEDLGCLGDSGDYEETIKALTKNSNEKTKSKSNSKEEETLLTPKSTGSTKRRSPRLMRNKSEANVTIQDLLHRKYLEIGQEISYLDEQGTLTKDGWIDFHNQRYSDLLSFCRQVRKFKQLGNDPALNEDTVWYSIFTKKKSTLADIRSRFMESNPKDTHKKRKKYPPCNHLPKSKLIFDVSSLCNYIEDDLLEDKDKTAQTSCMFKEENASEETNTIQKPRYAPVVILEKKTKSTKKGTSKGAKITPKKPDSPKILKKKETKSFAEKEETKYIWHGHSRRRYRNCGLFRY